MIQHIKKPTAILFDWDNTLVNTFPVIYQGLHDTFTAMGMAPWSIEDILQNREGIHHSLRDSFPRIFGDRWEEAREVYFSSFLSNHLKKMDVLPGAEETLKLLVGKNVFRGVVSNKTGKHLRTEISFLGWDNYFDKVVGASDAVRDKPHADPVHLVLRDSGIEVGRDVILVGDSGTDVECAVNAGITPVIFGEHIFGQPNHHGHDYATFTCVKDHLALQKVLKNF